jgi:hypothetical protein
MPCGYLDTDNVIKNGISNPISETKGETMLTYRKSGWKNEQEREDALVRVGFFEGMQFFKSQNSDMVDSFSRFNLMEFSKTCIGDVDPRKHLDPNVAKICKEQICRLSLGFTNNVEGLFPSNEMLCYFEGFCRSARVLVADRKGHRRNSTRQRR